MTRFPRLPLERQRTVKVLHAWSRCRHRRHDHGDDNGVLQRDLVIEGTALATPLLNDGESAELVVNLPDGEYAYFCSVPAHRKAGMQGTLTVG